MVLGLAASLGMTALGSLLGKGDKGGGQQLPRMTPEQQQALRDFIQGGGVAQSPLYQQGSSYLMNLLNPSQESLDAFRQPYIDEFNQQVVPGLSEQFAGIGGMSSSAFNQSLSRAGENLAMQLGSIRPQMQMSALPQALGYAKAPYEQLLQAMSLQSNDNIYRPESQGFLGGLLENMSPMIGGNLMQGLGGLFGGMGGTGATPGINPSGPRAHPPLPSRLGMRVNQMPQYNLMSMLR